MFFFFWKRQDTLTAGAGFRFKSSYRAWVAVMVVTVVAWGGGVWKREPCSTSGHDNPPPSWAISKSQKNISIKAENPKWQLRNQTTGSIIILSKIRIHPLLGTRDELLMVTDFNRSRYFLRTCPSRLLLSFVSWVLVWVRHDHGSCFSENYSGKGDEGYKECPTPPNTKWEWWESGSKKVGLWANTRKKAGFLNKSSVRSIPNLMLLAATPQSEGSC